MDVGSDIHFGTKSSCKSWKGSSPSGIRSFTLLLTLIALEEDSRLPLFHQYDPETQQQCRSNKHDKTTPELQAQIVAAVVADQRSCYGTADERSRSTDCLGHPKTSAEDFRIGTNDWKDTGREGNQCTAKETFIQSVSRYQQR